MIKDKPICANCKFWNAENIPAAKITAENDPLAACLRNPPTVFRCMTPKPVGKIQLDPTKQAMQMIEEFKSTWPTTKASQWCGEHTYYDEKAIDKLAALTETTGGDGDAG